MGSFAVPKLIDMLLNSAMAFSETFNASSEPSSDPEVLRQYQIRGCAADALGSVNVCDATVADALNPHYLGGKRNAREAVLMALRSVGFHLLNGPEARASHLAHLVRGYFTKTALDIRAG